MKRANLLGWVVLGLLLAGCGPALPPAFPNGTPTPVQPIWVWTALTATAIHATAIAPQPTETPLPATATLPAATPTPTPSPDATSAAATASPTIPADTVYELNSGRLAPGFSLTIYGSVPEPSALTFGPDGRLYVASAQGLIYALADRDGDRRAEDRQQYARDLPVPLGLAWVQDELYVSYRGAVAALKDADGDGRSDQTRPVVGRLPSFGLHQNDGLALGPDGYLYMGMGSTCDHCQERDPRSASILRFRPDGSDLSIFATGMRNPYDLAFNAAGDLFATDNGRDDLGLTEPPEELNHVRQGLDYGWPDCWAGATAPQCATRASPVATFTAHTSADGLAFYYRDQFPPEYYGNAFVALLGSIYLMPENPEHGLARVQLTKTGDSYVGRREWFLELPDGRPVDVTTGPDGGLYVADYTSGRIYRIVWGPP